MSKYTYKNISKLPQLLIGVGEIKPGATFDSDFEVNNTNFEQVKKSKTPAKDTK